EADMHQHPIAYAVLHGCAIFDDARNVYFALNPAHIDHGEFAPGIRDFDDPARNSQTHGFAPIPRARGLSWLIVQKSREQLRWRPVPARARRHWRGLSPGKGI